MYLLVIFFSRQGGNKEKEIERERERERLRWSLRLQRQTPECSSILLSLLAFLFLSPYIYGSAVLDRIEDGA